MRVVNPTHVCAHCRTPVVHESKVWYFPIVGIPMIVVAIVNHPVGLLLHIPGWFLMVYWTLSFWPVCLTCYKRALVRVDSPRGKELMATLPPSTDP